MGRWASKLLHPPPPLFTRNADAGNISRRDVLPDIKDTVRCKTFAQYESVVRCHLAPALGRLKLVSLTTAHVRALCRKTLDSGLAPRTVQYIHTTLHKALKQDVDG
jgi:hypothetical protein